MCGFISFHSFCVMRSEQLPGSWCVRHCWCGNLLGRYPIDGQGTLPKVHKTYLETATVKSNTLSIAKSITRMVDPISHGVSCAWVQKSFWALSTSSHQTNDISPANPGITYSEVRSQQRKSCMFNPVIDFEVAVVDRPWGDTVCHRIVKSGVLCVYANVVTGQTDRYMGAGICLSYT